MKSLFLIILISVFYLNSFSNVIIVEGKFQNKNIYIQNSFATNGVGFCTTEIKVNGKISTDEINSSAFEIDLSAMDIKLGQKVTIEIIHKNDCSPIVLNPEVLKPRPTYDIISMNVNANGLLKWTSKNESGVLPYLVEQFKWNKWVIVGEVKGFGTPETHNYSFNVSTHSGENKFRVKQTGIGVPAKTSNAVVVNAMTAKPTYIISKDGKSLQYSTETAFEIYDVFGTVVKKGFGKETSIDNLTKGKYFLCYDNLVTEFDKKK